MLIQIRATHIKSGKTFNKRINVKDPGKLIQILGKHGWIVNRLVTIL